MGTFLGIGEAFLDRASGFPRLYAITDASAGGMPDGIVDWGGCRVIKKGERITLGDGTTLADSAITMLHAFRNLIKIGLSLEEAVEITSVRQAEYLGVPGILAESSRGPEPAWSSATTRYNCRACGSTARQFRRRRGPERGRRAARPSTKIFGGLAFRRRAGKGRGVELVDDLDTWRWREEFARAP